MPRLICFTLAFLLGPALTVRALKVAVIGAGPAGLASLKNIVEQGHKVDVYEQSESIGGIWWYTDKTGNDDFGNPIHTPMYKGLRTNGPYLAMEFPNHHYPQNTQSYPAQKKVFEYLNSYVKKYKLKEHIKFHHKVEKVIPTENENNKWEVTVKMLKKNETKTETYDAVFVCTGVFSLPRKLVINGMDSFTGEIFHSHDYRDAKKYRGKKVLVIGSGTSGKDIVQQLTKLGVEVSVSIRNDKSEKRKLFRILFGDDFPIKGAVEKIESTKVFFKGEEEGEEFDVIIYATGYNFNYPFLTDAVGIKFDKNHVRPLYKQILNIEHPTMAFIGVTYSANHNQMYDLQARFALKFISGMKDMPSKEVMEEDLRIKTQALRDENIPEEKTHLLGKLKHKEYYKELADTAGIENIDDVYADIFTDAENLFAEHPIDFRSYKYIIINDGIKKEFKRLPPQIGKENTLIKRIVTSALSCFGKKTSNKMIALK